MSQWTHVSGVIRYDSVFNSPSKSDLEKLLGNTCKFDSSSQVKSLCNVPCGSEGSIQYKIVEVNKIDNLARWVVVIWGDLRDYDNTKEIIEWWDKVTITSKMVRDSVLYIAVEGREPIILSYSGLL